MNGVEYYHDRRVDRSQYKGLSFRLRDGGCLTLGLPLARLCAAPAPRAASRVPPRPRRTRASALHPAVECRPDGYSAAYAPCDRRHAPAMCNDGMAHARNSYIALSIQFNSGIRTKQTLAVECRPGLQTQP